MTDLVERLKGGCLWFTEGQGTVNPDATDELLDEAADEIVSLRARIATLEAERDEALAYLRRYRPVIDVGNLPTGYFTRDPAEVLKETNND